MHSNVYDYSNTGPQTNKSTTNLLNLSQLQTNAIIKMLNYNESLITKPNSRNKSSIQLKDNKPIWKILLFDKFSQQLVASVLKVNDLRDNGVTLHLPIEAKRISINDVPAIYLVKPTMENIHLITEDLKNGLYDSTYLNFTSALPRSLLEELANRSVSTDSFVKISQVYDQYLSYQCLDTNLFSLEVKDAYSKLNSKASTDNVIESCLDDMVTGLVSVLVTLGDIPTIKATKGNAAELLAKKLDAKLREFTRSTVNSLNSEDTIFTNSSNPKNRPVLILVDRNFDLIPMVAHCWDYQPLTHDLLNLTNNRCQVPSIPPQKYDIDLDDKFWAANNHLPFPQVAEAIDSALSQYKLDAEHLTNTSQHDTPDVINSASKLKLAVDALPELTARKTCLDLHMNLATALLENIQKRHIDRFVELEASILRQPRATVMDLLNDSECEAQDKLRLVLVYYLSHPNLNVTDLQPMVDILTQLGVDTTSIDAVTKLLSISRMSTLSAGNQSTTSVVPPSSNNDLLERFATIGSQLRDNAYGKILTKVKDFLPVQTDLALTKLVSNTLEQNSSATSHNLLSSSDDLLHIDPKSNSPMARSTPPLVSTNNFNASKSSTVIVFMVGAGNYLEFQNLNSLYKKLPYLKRIIYGSTQLINPNSFLDQLKQII